MLFIGGFVLAIAASKTGLDLFLARVMLKPFGKNPKWVLLGFLMVTGIFSMFLSNTATAAMMLTFLGPVLKALPADGKGKTALALAIPIAANVGGMGQKSNKKDHTIPEIKEHQHPVFRTTDTYFQKTIL